MAESEVVKKENKWNDEIIEELVNLYHTNDCLWKMTIKDYRDQHKKLIILEQIDKRMKEYSISRLEYQRK